LEIIVEVLDKSKSYYKIFWEVWILINSKLWYEKILNIIDVFLEKNNKTIFNLIKWI